MNRRAVFLDRDGVLVETLVREGRAFAALTLDEFRLCADAGPQVARLRAAGLLPVVFTNQPEMARGTLSATTLGRMHDRLRAAVGVADIFVCPHDDAADCALPEAPPGHAPRGGGEVGYRSLRLFRGGRPLARHRRRPRGGLLLPPARAPL